ncbi:rod-binding protein [Thalassospira xiamenensis]|uniref:Rod binding protein n=1 Tax=Thalassospira xiamenensis TaxID=220697 RepID=A0A285RNT0_9PROT|nr:rod-binding protein [Thalassospira xiamenensis]SOB95379.1 Rod binding protein [Thalassospira xiamenensis]
MMIDSTSALMAQAQASAQYGAQNNVTSRASQLTDGHIKTDAQARKAGEEFESMFLGQMLSHMFAGIETNEMFGGGHGETMMRSLLVDEYAKEMTRAGGIGIADAVTREILKVQEG